MYNKIKQNNKCKIALCFLCIFLFMCFVSNIIMHLSSYSVGSEKGKQLTDISYVGCEIQDGYYVPLTDDPQMHLTREPSEEIRGIRIEFLEPLETDTHIEIFYPEEKTGDYTVERSSGGIAKAGERSVSYRIEAGAYKALRIDIDGVVKLQGIYEDTSYSVMLYADKPYRNKIYGFCMLISAGLCVSIFCFQKLRDWQERTLKVLCAWIDAFFARRKIFLGLLKITLAGICVGAFIEGVLTLFLKRPYYNTKEMAILSLLCILVLSLLFFREYYKKNIEMVFLVVFMYCGICFSCVIPVSLGISWDDEVHYYKSVLMARFASGEITCAEASICAGYAEAICDETRWERETCKEKGEYYKCLYDTGEVYGTSRSFSYASIAYTSYVIGIWISYGLGLSFNACGRSVVSFHEDIEKWENVNFCFFYDSNDNVFICKF